MPRARTDTTEAEHDVVRNNHCLLGLIAVLALGALGATRAAAAHASAYDQLIRSDNPAMYLAMSSPSAGRETDLSGRGHTGTYHPARSYPAQSRLPNGDPVATFDGATQYLEVPDANDLSVTSRGELTIEAWIRPDTLQFPSQEGSGYVHFLGKGAPNQQEYAARMYSKVNDEARPNRISGYAFNLAGGLGSGSYSQVPVRAGAWILVDIVINTRITTATYPTGYVKIFRNGQLKDTTGLDQFDVVPGNGTAPLRIGTRDFASYFQGAIGKVALYLHELTPDQMLSHHDAMVM
jgi:Concanavalin A-like lectin/glucanases superfamily